MSSSFRYYKWRADPSNYLPGSFCGAAPYEILEAVRWNGTNFTTAWDDKRFDGQCLTTWNQALAVGSCYRWLVDATDRVGNAATTLTSPEILVQNAIELVEPLASWTLFSSERLTASVSSAYSVATVEFLLDGVVLATLTQEPWIVDWDTTTAADGPHELAARVTFADARVALSPTVPVTVANALPADERLDADYEAARIDVDFYAVNGVYAMGAPQVVPPRYISSTLSSADGIPIVRYTGLWEQLTEPAKTEISQFLNQPLRGLQYSALVVAGMPPPQGIRPEENCVYVENFHLLGPPEWTGYRCVHESDRAIIRYTVLATGALAAEMVAVDDALDENPQSQQCTNRTDPYTCNGVPDYVDKIARALDDAYSVYVDVLGFQQSWLGKVNVVVRGIDGGQVLPNPLGDETIDLSKLDDAPFYLAHHELFHMFQYQFVREYNLADSFFLNSGPWWWMEASAEWASGQVARNGKFAEIGADARLLPHFLGRPSERLSQLDNPVFDRTRRHQYGAFIFAEYLVENLDGAENVNIVREIWEGIAAQPDPQNVEPVLETIVSLPQRGKSLPDVIADFWRANYLLEYSTRATLRTALLAGTDTGPDIGPPRRPERPKRDFEYFVDGQLHAGLAQIARGGGAMVELLPTGGGLAQFAVSVDADTPMANVALMALNYSDANAPVICSETSLALDANGVASGVIRVEGVCQYAVLFLTANNAASGPDSVQVDWSATMSLLPGARWTAHPTDPAPFTGRANFRWSAFGNGRWVVGGNVGSIWSASDPAGSWTQSNSASAFGTSATQAAFFGQGHWVAVGANGKLATSTDAVNWTLHANSSFGTSHIQDVFFAGGLWVAVGNDGKLATATDPTGAWTQRSSGFALSSVQSVVYGNGLWIATGSNNTWAKSTDGVSWVQQNPFTLSAGGLVADRIAFGNGTWVFVTGIANGAYAAIWASPDAITWTKTAEFSCPGQNIGRPVFGGGLWILGAPAANCVDNTLQSSPDLATWTPRHTLNTSTGQTRAVSYDGNGTWVHAGIDPYILYSR